MNKILMVLTLILFLGCLCGVYSLSKYFLRQTAYHFFESRIGEI